MSLATNVSSFATRVATESKALRTLINGNQPGLTGLTTTAKENLVAAINELQTAVQDAAESGGAAINDSTTTTSSVWSSSKTSSAIAALVDTAPGTLDTLNELAAALGDDPNFSTTITNLIGTKATDTAVVHNTGAETIAGVKTFSVAPVVPDGSFTIAKTTGLQSTLDGKAAATHTHPSTAISDATATGRALITATDGAAARTTIGAGTSNLVLGTTAGTAKAGDYTPPTASETVQGIVELATTAEATAGTDTARAITPAGLKVVADTKASTVDVGDTNTNFVTTFEAGLV